MKDYAERNNYDGFAFFNEVPSLEWINAVWYKDCEVHESYHLSHALVP